MKTVSDILLDLVAIPTASTLANQPVIDYARSMASRTVCAWGCTYRLVV